MTRHATPRVLVVDDEAAIRRLLVRFLSARGCQVETAADGAEALERLGGSSFDVVLCDVTMPRLDGVKLWDAVQRQAATSPAPPFLFVSAVPLPPGAPRSPAVRYLPKPFALEELWREVQALLSR